MRKPAASMKWYWITSIGVSVALFLSLLMMWFHEDRNYLPNIAQIDSPEKLDRFLQHLDIDQKPYAAETAIYVPTGVFVDSVKFLNATDVQVCGYVWQQYTDGVHDGLERGFVLPEIVDSAGTATREIAYRRREGNREVIGWYVEATLRQTFDYARYPLDHKTAWMRIVHRDFDRNVILTPDFSAYTGSTRPGAVFGVSKTIELGGWRLEETYFDYELSDYDTNFGIRHYIGQTGFPELRFNLVLKRDFMNAFVINLVPLLVVSALLFSVLMLTTANSEKAERFGFNTSTVFGTGSALFFVVMLAHIQLREQFGGVGIVYLEYFYLLMYVLILVISVDSYLFSQFSDRLDSDSWAAENLTPKLLYWPFLLLACIGLTVIGLYT